MEWSIFSYIVSHYVTHRNLYYRKERVKPLCSFIFKIQAVLIGIYSMERGSNLLQHIMKSLKKEVVDVRLFPAFSNSSNCPLSLSILIQVSNKKIFINRIFYWKFILLGIPTFVCSCNWGSLDSDCWCRHWSASLCSSWNHCNRNWTLCRNYILWDYPLSSTRTCYCKF